MFSDTSLLPVTSVCSRAESSHETFDFNINNKDKAIIRSKCNLDGFKGCPVLVVAAEQ